jgi:hypothetical protein
MEEMAVSLVQSDQVQVLARLRTLQRRSRSSDRFERYEW